MPSIRKQCFGNIVISLNHKVGAINPEADPGAGCGLENLMHAHSRTRTFARCEAGICVSGFSTSNTLGGLGGVGGV